MCGKIGDVLGKDEKNETISSENKIIVDEKEETIFSENKVEIKKRIIKKTIVKKEVLSKEELRNLRANYYDLDK